MTRPALGAAEWEAANGDFLAASLAWLRLLLQRRRDPAEQPPSPSAIPHRGGRMGRLFGRDEHESPQLALPVRASISDDEIANAAARVAHTEQCTPPPALVELAARLGLSRFERDILLLCAALDLDPSVADLCARAHGNDHMRYPTFGLALEMLPDPAWDAVAPRGGLRYWKLVEITQRSGEGLISAALRADERIVNYVKGLNDLDDRLSPVVTSLDSSAAAQLPDSQQVLAQRIEREWTLGPTGTPTVQLAGLDPAGKRLVAAHAARRCGLLAYRLPADLIPTQPTDLDNLARLWERESALLPVALYIDAEDIDDENAAARTPISRFLTRIGGQCALAVRESWSDVGRGSVVLDVEAPSATERAEAWQASLAEGTDMGAIDALSAQFALQICDIAEIASMSDDSADAWHECRARTRPRLDALARRLEPRVDWDDIVLPEAARTLLERVAAQVSHRTTVYDDWGFGRRINRGLGVSVLFAGPSGTGKTMAAEVLASRLKLDLYRIDLSAVVSKYIGETEKNLRKLFDAGESGGAILLFDEADSIFGKRSQVKDAHDRYANIEINYLLQRMEAYHGLAILATNMRGALDPAFLRRLRFVVEFTFPDVGQRRQIWVKSFPSDAPVADLDFDRLAQLPVSGGMARNIAVNAAFLAAAADGRITMANVLTAARMEFEKLELPIRDREFALSTVGA
ncbi:ATP-binding protein [Mycolicibacterium rufum]|uniref:AAA family ATPase n=1 Tax=Mycolicibacterium rufum TaxID=318424 RepID=A0A9X2YAD6_9MYCO|nr:ATP-binding protein [Mycolicibacterium rufum]KGI67124.1 hypothetical protein EU78_06240 [Mycolicibacterium rufum]MCV7070113.1 AAA family ATPase [Mycolicibacterium rufum]ULP37991.1 ATP-binding protein [Mycolicibacterium rufum]